MNKEIRKNMKLHLGCGKRFIPGFVHIDAVPFDHVDHVSTINDLSFITDESVELIYACHVLEHFQRNKVIDVLKEWRRVLIKGGILRLAVPDFESLAELYVKNKNLSEIIGPIFGRQDYLYNIHYNVFDFKTLKSNLMLAGFEYVERYDWRNTEHAHIDDYSQSYVPHMDKQFGTLISLNVEAR